MTKEDLVEMLHTMADPCRPGCDKEADHFTADNLLLEYIGDEEISEAFYDIPKWYS